MIPPLAMGGVGADGVSGVNRVFGVAPNCLGCPSISDSF
jgi:hypothetical protein